MELTETQESLLWEMIKREKEAHRFLPPEGFAHILEELYALKMIEPAKNLYGLVYKYVPTQKGYDYFN